MWGTLDCVGANAPALPEFCQTPAIKRQTPAKHAKKEYQTAKGE
ncbi:hypothetical protein CUS_6553 [Ruminococcus albus 8]|uniref:Uncharacterized protein n=1 Tax=Ruminococcus albus 8 TaxID=246199 RepID=E9SB81_RUMAL|nr:hypothetical protein CUS_6553 [Ruminococcus albus 8]